MGPPYTKLGDVKADEVFGNTGVSLVEWMRRQGSGFPMTDERFAELVGLDEKGRAIVTIEEFERMNHITMDRKLDIGGFSNDPDDRELMKSEKTLPELECYRQILEAVKDGKWLYMRGDTGTGKTIAASALAVKYMEKKPGRRATFLTVAEAMARLRPSENQIHITALLEKFRSFVVIDDLGAEKMTNWVVEQLFMIVDHLGRGNYKVAITSNLPLEHFYQKNAPTALRRVGDRIRGKSREILFLGDSRR